MNEKERGRERVNPNFVTLVFFSFFVAFKISAAVVTHFMYLHNKSVFVQNFYRG